MYDWTTHTHTHLGGRCSHECSYCFVQRGMARMSHKYEGQICLHDHELCVDYGIGKIIFVEHCNDLFAKDVPEQFIEKILSHCRIFPDNEYVFQTKNPIRYIFALGMFPPKFILGTTIETNRSDVIKMISKAPDPAIRYLAMSDTRLRTRKFVTVEPILDFDPEILAGWITAIAPEFVNIGADSKGTGLLEPTPGKIERLIQLLNENKVTIRKKTNLERIIKV
jgi:DNA repair photolyase